MTPTASSTGEKIYELLCELEDATLPIQRRSEVNEALAIVGRLREPRAIDATAIAVTSMHYRANGEEVFFTVPTSIAASLAGDMQVAEAARKLADALKK